ncbi:MAG: T9SS C-terminal target domain-containing protein [Cryomorphaceae bacterium]|nr:MAG: T9SS C-terminal target domain-containing protein [Cryomorphaceae bacterium]
MPNGWSGSSSTASINATAGENGGAITVTANNNCGSSTASIQIVESHPLPTVTFELDSSIICNNFGDFPLTGGLPEGGTYSGPGVSDNVFSPAEAGAGIHLITYSYTDENECSQTAEQEITVEVCTDVRTLNNETVLIYPNPFRQSLVLEFEENRARVIEFHNAIGQIVHTLQDNGVRITVDANHLAPGIYFIRISGDEKVHRVVRSQ